MSRASVVSVGFAWLLAALCACRAEAPPGGLELSCARSCEGRVAGCSAPQCARGCNLILDRLAEHAGGPVLACVAASSVKTGCDDRAWARCAVRVGPHADGGPPAPPPPSDTEEPGEGD